MRVPSEIRELLVSGDVEVTVSNVMRVIEKMKAGNAHLSIEIKEFYTAIKIRQFNWISILVARGNDVSELAEMSFEELRDLMQDTEAIHIVTVSASGKVSRTVTKLAA